MSFDLALNIGVILAGAFILGYIVKKVNRLQRLEKENELLKLSKDLNDAKKDISSLDLTDLVDRANERARKRRDHK